MSDPFEVEQLKTGFWVGDWFVEPLLNRISKNGEDSPVEPKVMEVLLCLAQRPGRTVTKDHFMEHVWADTVVTDDVLSRCISELRKVFRDDSRNPQFIETIRKTGYRLIAPVAFSEADAEPSVMAQRMALLTGRRQGRALSFSTIAYLLRQSLAARFRHRLARPIMWGVLVGGLVVIIGGVLWSWRIATLNTPAPPATIPFTSFAGLEVDPVVSPDGRQVAFAWNNNTGRDFDIYIKQSGAETPLRITDERTDERQPAWSPDGLHLAFIRSSKDNQGIFIIPSIGGSERMVADFGRRRIQDLAWSPDGQTLAVMAQDAPYGVFSIFLVTVDGAKVQQLTFPPPSSVGGMALAYAPDGERLAFTRRVNEDVEDIFVVSVAGGEPKQITFDSTHVAGLDWTVDGKAIVFASHRGDVSGLWRVSASGGAPEWIAAASEGQSLEAPSVARHGNRLAYVQRSSNVNIWRQQNNPRFTIQPLIFSTRWDSNPDISPNGERIAFASNQSGHQELWLCDRDGSNPVQLTTFAGAATGIPRWSPDGKAIAFVSRQDGQADIYVIGAEGGVPRRLTTSPAEDTAPSWSRDSLWVYFASNRNEQWQIWKAPRDSGAVVQVTRDGGRAAVESPDGTRLYYVKPDTAGIWRRPLAPMTPSDEQSDLLIASLDPFDWGNWTVVADGIYFVDREGDTPALMFYSFVSARRTRVAILKNTPYHPSFAVAPDRTWLLYTQVDDNESDILLMEHFR